MYTENLSAVCKYFLSADKSTCTTRRMRLRCLSSRWHSGSTWYHAPQQVDSFCLKVTCTNYKEWLTEQKITHSAHCCAEHLWADPPAELTCSRSGSGWGKCGFNTTLSAWDRQYNMSIYNIKLDSRDRRCYCGKWLISNASFFLRTAAWRPLSKAEVFFSINPCLGFRNPPSGNFIIRQEQEQLKDPFLQWVNFLPCCTCRHSCILPFVSCPPPAQGAA